MIDSIRARWRSLARAERALVLVFLCTLPFLNPAVRGDGMGYYAYLRSLLIEGRLDFRNDWLAAPEIVRAAHVDAAGNLVPGVFTGTGMIANHFTIGPALLWAPTVALAHLAVLVARKLGASVAADGFSWPYTLTMAVTTATYGFIGLALAFRLARRSAAEAWAFLAVIGIWFATAVPVYMYLSPALSHTHSIFTVALFLWYWERTRESRTMPRWIWLGLLSGLMLNVYYANAALLAVPLVESLAAYRSLWRTREWRGARTLFGRTVAYLVATTFAVLPTLVSRQLVYGDWLELGYTNPAYWSWLSPQLVATLFSANHGVISWTPILGLAILGLWPLRRRDPVLASGLACSVVAFVYVVASFHTWWGGRSFGNRYVISLTPVFVIGLASGFEWLASKCRSERAARSVAAVTIGVLIAWNAGLLCQWSMRVIPREGEIDWGTTARNQVTMVPALAIETVTAYIRDRFTLVETRSRMEEGPPRAD